MATKKITLSIPNSLDEEIQNMAANYHITKSSLAVQAIKYYIKIKKRKKAIGELLNMAGNVTISDDAVDILKKDRAEDDRI